VGRARLDRDALRALDSDRLLGGAARRAAFNLDVARLEGELAGALRGVASDLGLAELTLAGLAARAPQGGAALSRSLGAIGAAAGELARLDAVNRTLATRALACVQGHLSALRPAPAAYDRRGGRAPTSAEPAFSSKA
jgi:hypothetical protein